MLPIGKHEGPAPPPISRISKLPFLIQKPPLPSTMPSTAGDDYFDIHNDRQRPLPLCCLDEYIQCNLDPAYHEYGSQKLLNLDIFRTLRILHTTLHRHGSGHKEKLVPNLDIAVNLHEK